MKLKRIIILVLAALLLFSPFTYAFVLINEILADPPAAVLGDANQDGIVSTTQDEFVEFLNFGQDSVDLSGWYVSDSTSARHIFPGGTNLPGNNFLVVFGGGNPSLSGIVTQTASSGTLGLNNTGDQVTLYNTLNQIMSQVTYGSPGNHDQSITRFPDGAGQDFVLHSSIAESHGKIFSPGTAVDGQTTVSVVPEMSSHVLWQMGLLLLGFKRKMTTNKFYDSKHG